MNPDHNEITPEPIGVPLAIAIAAFVYPLVLVWPFTLLLLINENLLDILQAILLVTGMAVIFGCVLFVGVLVASSLVEWVLGAVQRSLEFHWSEARRGAHTGAWVAFLTCTLNGLFLMKSAPYVDFAKPLVMALLLLLGPGLATPLFQYAGAWSQWRTKAAMSTRRWTFGIRHVLVITAWIAGALALLKVLNLLSRDFLAYFIGWLVYQYATMELVLQFCHWRAHRFLKRRGGDGGGEGDVDGKRGA